MTSRLFAILALLICLTSGCTTINGPSSPSDPFESYNRSMYAFNDGLDVYFLKPAGTFYQEHVPEPISKGTTNFFSNLDDVLVFVNDILQLKFMQAASDLSRIFFNTTIGLLGFIDVASSMDMPKHNEDFGQTLGYWGVPSGPYFIMPFFGPSTVRDTAGFATDSLYIDPVYKSLEVGETVSVLVVDAIDTRAGLLQASKLVDQASLDPYIYIREAILQRREYLVYDGNPPLDEDDFGDF